MSTLVIRGGRCISPADGLDAEMDVVAADGVILEVAPASALRADEIFDARGQIVCPGLIDMHVHLREPGGEESETLETGLAAAVAGGFTSVCPMPNTTPVNDSPEATRRMIERSKHIALAHLFPIAAVSLRSEGEELSKFGALKAAGAVAFSDDGRPVKTPELLRKALEQARDCDLLIIDHCEDRHLSAGGAINAGKATAKLGVKGIPNAAEDACVARDVQIAAETGARVHVAHISTAGAVDLVRAAKARGVRVTAEATPHHFTLTDEAVIQYGAAAKMNPPLRSAHDREAVIEALADRTIDAIATDHAPHAPRLKALPLETAPFGIIGLETALGLAMRELVVSGRISIGRLIELLSVEPARILRLPFGRLRAGAPADITIFDPHRSWTYHASAGRSKSRNSPFDGWTLTGKVTATIVDGQIVYRG